MTELAYMTRDSWAQNGSSMEPQSAVIRKWLGEPPYVFAAASPKGPLNSVDKEFVDFVVADVAFRQILDFSQLRELKQVSSSFKGTVTVLHPHDQADVEALRELADSNKLSRILVIIWFPSNMVRFWLDGVGARDLDTGLVESPDAVQLEAAKCMVNEQYNGLSTGNGKAAVVQLVRAFTAGGYVLEKEPWLKAFFAAGGEFRHAESISKLISEMKKGTKHRVQQRYRQEILSILQERASA